MTIVNGLFFIYWFSKIPIIVDNTTATPYLCRPIEHGATLVVHSTTKYLTGNGTVTGGVVIDSGNFDWGSSGKFPSLSEPEKAYHGMRFQEAFGPLAFTFHGIAVGLRDLGMTMNPQAAHYTLMGIETLSLRMKKHVENAIRVANWLEADPRTENVTYAGLKSSKYFSRIKTICPRGAGALFTVAIKGGYNACLKFVDSLEIFSHVANLGDARSLVIHPASTTHRQLTTEQQKAAGSDPGLVRISIGIEDNESNILEEYFKYLNNIIDDMGNDWIVIPGHEFPYYNPTKRAKKLILHHRSRLELLVTEMKKLPLTVKESMEILFGQILKVLFLKALFFLNL